MHCAAVQSTRVYATECSSQRTVIHGKTYPQGSTGVLASSLWSAPESGTAGADWL